MGLILILILILRNRELQNCKLRNSKLLNSELRNKELWNSELQKSKLQHTVDYRENIGSGKAELLTSGSTLQKNSGSGTADQR
jgi:hypothetical protein